MASHAADRPKGRCLNRAELADFFGVAKTTVDDWIRRGCPALEKSKGKGSSWRFSSAQVSSWLLDEARESGIRDTAAIDFDEAKRRKTAADAALAELSLKERRGELVDAEEIRQVGQEAFLLVRQGLESIPQQLAPRFAVMTDPKRIEKLLRDAISERLHALSDFDPGPEHPEELDGDAPPAGADEGQRVGQ